MNRRTYFRVGTFALAIVLVALLMGWAAHTTWRQVQLLRERLTRVQIESFQIADQFRASLNELDYRLLRYEIHRDSADRDQFLQEWKKLDTWIDVQRPNLTSTSEGEILDQINAAYDYYFSAATNLMHTIETKSSLAESPLAGFENVEGKSQRLIELVYQLANAHGESLNRFLADSQKSLAYLRSLIFSALFLLLLLGAWLATVVYREMITPLRLKLVESRTIIERQEKLASLGMLAAGVAHEIRNPLTAIKACLFMQQKQFKPGTPQFADAELISKEIGRLERIVKDFLRFARPSDPQLVTLAADELLREVQALLSPELAKANIRLALENSASAQVRVDPQQIKQVLINLVQNAADSVGHNGGVTLRTRCDTKRLGDRTIDAVILEVADTGKGIPPEVEKRLFDPFFTTKEGGTGLGLPIASRIVEKHGGALQYQTQLNRGTTFGVVLPRYHE
ncbi:MAG: hypothetical protein HY298_05195 [Verrucomicrobia bacterium]|nr:hypothetical protein [Verrucomicrobiota bacterium]